MAVVLGSDCLNLEGARGGGGGPYIYYSYEVV